MKSYDLWKSALLVLATAGTLVPGSQLTAADASATNDSHSSSATAVTDASVNNRASANADTTSKAIARVALEIQDVVLGENGEMTGYVLDGQGKAIARTKVAVRIGRQTVAETTTDNDGRFLIPELRSGVCQIVHSDGVSVFRVWKNGTAPRNARSNALMIVGKKQIRGQNEGTPSTLLDHGALLTFGAAAAGTTLGIVGLSEASKANNKADAANARLDSLFTTTN
jgi:hypothetical protein